MKYLILFVVSVATIISVTGKIPSYIKVCKRNDPDINGCITNSILSIKQQLITGIPELQVPPIDPLYLDKLTLNFGPGFKAEGRNLQVREASNFKIHKVVSDTTRNTYSFDISIPQATVTGDYFVDAAIGNIPIKGQGPFNLVARMITGQGTLFGKFATRHGKTYSWFPKMTLKVQIGDYTINLGSLFEGDSTITEVTNKLLNEEKVEVLSTLIPSFEKAVIEQILGAANNITKNFTWDELFPVS